MLAKPSPPRFEVQIVIIIIIIAIFLCVAFLYYSISVNFLESGEGSYSPEC